MSTNIKNINTQALFPLIIIPAILFFLAFKYDDCYGLGGQEILLVVISYYICNITVGIGFHRLWSHGAYKTNKFVEFILILLSAGTLQGPVLSWASDHYKHHTYTDEDQDPHSPLKYKSKIAGFFWSHIGWMIFKSSENKQISKIVIVKLARNKLIMWQFKYYWRIAIAMNLLLPALVGYFLSYSFQGALSGVIFIGIGRALQQHATFFINSLCHFFGSRKYTNNTSGDIWWLAPFLLGENWHNYHHAFPMDYRNGMKWYQFDVHKWIIYLMSKLGLAWDLHVTPKVRIQAKMDEKNKVVAIETQNQWFELQAKADQLKEMLSGAMANIENSSNQVKAGIKKQLRFIQDNLNYISQQSQLLMQMPENSTKNMLSKATKQIKKFEALITNLVNKFNVAPLC